MSYSDIATAIEGARQPFIDLGSAYQKSSDQLAAAAPLDSSGSVTIYEAALRGVVANVEPPGESNIYDRLTRDLDLGFMRDGDRLVAPWSALTDPEVFGQFDVNMWRFLGFLRDSADAGDASGKVLRSHPFDGLDGVPDVVTTPENMANLYATAAVAETPVRAPSALFLSSVGTRALVALPVSARRGAVQLHAPVRTTGDIGHSTQALTADDSAKITAALTSIQAGWDNPFVLRICISSASAEVILEVLKKGVNEVMTKVLPQLTNGLIAIVGAAGGMAALFIALSAAYWAIWIGAAKNANGVCLHIPMPWSFGVIGPGWATGR